MPRADSSPATLSDPERGADPDRGAESRSAALPSAVGAARSIVRGAPAYPAALDDLARPPDALFVAGVLAPLSRAVAIVGTRRASGDGRAIARALGRDLARAGVLVVSGAAHGIDAEAHTGALEAGVDGSTLAVIATPLDAPYPAAHLPLLRAIVGAGGGVLTETAPGAATFRASFLLRNRIIAALARAVVVVEAPARSGTLSTVRHARALARPVFAVPWSPLDEPRAGGVALLAEGGARACRDASDVLAALGWPRAQDAALPRLDRPDASSCGGSSEAMVLAALARGARHVDGIVEATGLPVALVSSTLLSLVLEGRATQEDGVHRAVR